jgi:hypothetical protein
MTGSSFGAIVKARAASLIGGRWKRSWRVAAMSSSTVLNSWCATDG